MRFNTILYIAGSVPGILASCNPLKSTDCPANTALGSSFKEDFTSESKYFSEVKLKGVSYSSDGLELKISERLDNPSLKSNFYIMFGKVEVELKAAKGKGIISSFYLQSDDLDEIDIELFGGDSYEFQLNYFSKGNTDTYDRGEYHPTSPSPLENFHTYTLDWTKDELTWSLDGKVVRTLKSNNPQGYPQSPMYVMTGIWAGGDPSNAEGTIEWAGGATDYSELPFSMYIKSLIVTDYSTGKEYKYGDQSGSWSSIEAVDGKVNGRVSEAKLDFEKLQDGESVDSDFEPSSTVSESSSSSSTTSSVSESELTSALSTESSSSSETSSSLIDSSSIVTSSSSHTSLSSTADASSTETSSSKASSSRVTSTSSVSSSTSDASTSDENTSTTEASSTSNPTTTQSAESSSDTSTASTLETLSLSSSASAESTSHTVSTANSGRVLGVSFLDILVSSFMCAFI